MTFEKNLVRVFVCIAALSCSVTAFAQQGAMQLQHKGEMIEKYTDVSGAEKTRLVDVEEARVVPGEVIIYTVTYTNNGDQPADSVAIKNPIPEQMEYLDSSAKGDNTSISFSVDGGTNYGDSDDLSVAAGDGTQRPAQAVDYTHVRWFLESAVAPGATGFVQFSAVVK